MGTFTSQIENSIKAMLAKGLPSIPCCNNGSLDNEHNLEKQLEHLLSHHKFVRITDAPPSIHSHKKGSCCLTKTKTHHWDLEKLEVDCSFKKISPINLEIDIICQNSTKHTLCIEIKKIFHNPTPSKPFSSHDYNYLYGLDSSISYKTISSKPHNFTCNYEWHGGPILEKKPNTQLLSYFQEGQIWWDIARLIEIKKQLAGPVETYAVGFIKLAKGSRVTGMQKRLETIVKMMQRCKTKEVYNESNQLLQKCVYNDFSFTLKCIYPNGKNPLNLAMAYLIEIT
jgi:hypothetical protein